MLCPLRRRASVCLAVRSVRGACLDAAAWQEDAEPEGHPSHEGGPFGRAHPVHTHQRVLQPLPRDAQVSRLLSRTRIVNNRRKSSRIVNHCQKSCVGVRLTSKWNIVADKRPFCLFLEGGDIRESRIAPQDTPRILFSPGIRGHSGIMSLYLLCTWLYTAACNVLCRVLPINGRRSPTHPPHTPTHPKKKFHTPIFALPLSAFLGISMFRYFIVLIFSIFQYFAMFGYSDTGRFLSKAGDDVSILTTDDKEDAPDSHLDFPVITTAGFRFILYKQVRYRISIS